MPASEGCVERAEGETAREQAEHARLILDTANDAFISIDEQGLVVDWNQAAERTLGWSSDEALGRPLAETIIPERYRAAHHRGVRRLLDTGQGPVLFETLQLPALHRDGHELPAELTIWPSRVGGRWRFNAFLRDVTERVQMQTHLRLLQRVTAAANAATELREAMDATLEEVAELTGWPVGHVYVRGWNQERLEPTGWWTAGSAPYERFRHTTERTDFVEDLGLPGRVVAQGRPCLISDLGADDNFPRTEIARQEGLVSAFAFPVLSGERVLAVLEFYSRSPDPPDAPLLELMADIGIQLGRVFERLRWHSELQTALETRSRLLSLVAHEVRTPAVVIEGYVELLVEDFHELDEHTTLAHLRAIREHVDRLQRLVTNALHSSRIEAGGLQAHPRAVTLGPFVDGLLGRLRLADEVAVQGERSLVAEVDPDHLEHILTNYLSNATRYGAPPVWVDLRAEPAPDDQSPGTAVVRVCDRGEGVPASFVPELFRSFRRGTASSGGAGLGLSIVRELAHANSADAWYEPLDPGGAAFAVRLQRPPRAST